MVNAGLVLEGGGMRGVFTAGVLDFFMDEGLDFKCCCGVSAGACHACSYLSHQRGRALAISLDYLDDRRYCGIYSLVTTGDLFGVDFAYDEIPNKLNIYDYAEFDGNQGELFAVVTNCSTGEAEYMKLEDMKRDILVVRASSSLPLVSRNVKIGDGVYLDGGIADPIPLQWSIEHGNARNVVVLTRDDGYRKKPESMMAAIKLRYRKYPNLIKRMEARHERYNSELDFVAEQEKLGTALVIRPQKPVTIKRVEKDRSRLAALYEEGYNEAKARRDELLEFLGK